MEQTPQNPQEIVTGMEEETLVQEQENEVDGAEARLAEAEAKLAEMNDKMLRALAEAQNIKRRAEIDVENAQKYAIERFAKDMASVLDHLFRAEESIPAEKIEQDEYVKALHEGIALTRKEMAGALSRHGVERIMPLGQKFDHNLHQAIAQLPTAGKEAGEVLDVVQAGYTLKGRLLRPAMVAVAAAPVETSSGSGSSGAPETEEF